MKRGAKAAAKRRMAEEAARLSSLTQPAPPLEEHFEEVLAAFRPRKVNLGRWDAEVGDFVRDVMRRSHNRGDKVFGQLLSELSLFVDWTQDRGVPLTIESILRHDLIEQWILNQHGEGKSSTWGGRRSRLRNLASHVVASADAPPRPSSFSRASVKAPYTLRECASLERLARNQPGAATRRQLSAMVALGLGAGLGPTDLRGLVAGNIVNEPDGWWVAVPGDRARQVPVRDRYVDLLEAALVGLEPEQLVIGRKVDRTNVTGSLVYASSLGATSVYPEQARLRSTWLLTLITSPIPFADIMALSGLSTARTITDLVPFAADPDYVDARPEGDR